MGRGSNRVQTLGTSPDDCFPSTCCSPPANAQRAGDLAAAEQALPRCSPPSPASPRATQLLGAILAERNELDARHRPVRASRARSSDRRRADTLRLLQQLRERAAPRRTATRQAEESCAQLVAVAPQRMAAVAQPRPDPEGPRALRRGRRPRCDARSCSSPSSARTTACSARCCTISAGCTAPTRRCAGASSSAGTPT